MFCMPGSHEHTVAIQLGIETGRCPLASSNCAPSSRAVRAYCKHTAYCKHPYPEMPITMAGSGVPSLTSSQLLSVQRSSACSNCSCLKIGYRASRSSLNVAPMAADRYLLIMDPPIYYVKLSSIAQSRRSEVRGGTLRM